MFKVMQQQQQQSQQQLVNTQMMMMQQQQEQSRAMMALLEKLTNKWSMDLCHSQVLQHILLHILEWLVDENILKNTLLDLQAHKIQMTSNHLLHLYCLFFFCWKSWNSVVTSSKESLLMLYMYTIVASFLSDKECFVLLLEGFSFYLCSLYK